MPDAPENRMFRESNLCALGPQPQIMTGLFITELRKHYASADNVEHAVFRERLYKKNKPEFYLVMLLLIG